MNDYFQRQSTPTQQYSSKPTTPINQYGSGNLLNKIVSSPYIPWIGGALGGLGGIPLAPFTGGMSIPFGALAGAGASGAAQNSLKDLLGIQTQKPLEQVKQTTDTAMNAAMMGEVLSMLGVGNLGNRQFQEPVNKIQTTQNKGPLVKLI